MLTDILRPIQITHLTTILELVTGGALVSDLYGFVGT